MTTKRLWTPELHETFVSAIRELGTAAKPREIRLKMRATSTHPRVSRLTDSQIASYKQRYVNSRLETEPAGNKNNKIPVPNNTKLHVRRPFALFFALSLGYSMGNMFSGSHSKYYARFSDGIIVVLSMAKQHFSRVIQNLEQSLEPTALVPLDYYAGPLHETIYIVLTSSIVFFLINFALKIMQ